MANQTPIRTPEQELLTSVRIMSRHRLACNLVAVAKAVADGYVTVTIHDNVQITPDGRERLDQLED